MEHESFVAHALRDFLMLFVTIDPIGTLSLFVPLTAILRDRGFEAFSR